MADPQDTHTTVIGPDAVIKGEMTFDSAARLLGTIEGAITAKGQFHVADGAKCRASINAEQVTIDGTVEGDVIASQRIELNATATLKGDLTAAKLVVTEGASFVGHCHIGPDHVASNGRAPAAASTTPAASAKPDQSQRQDEQAEPTPKEVKPTRAKATASNK